MTEQSHHIVIEQPGRQAVVTIQDIAKGLECGNPACCCHNEGPNGWRTHCPAHGDENPSLSLNQGEGGKILWHCHAGCDQTEVSQALEDRELWPSRTANPGTYSSRPPRGEMETVYSYLDAEGKLAYESCRFKLPKRFCFRRPDGQGGHTYDLEGVQLVLFNLPDVLQAQMVFIAEGEKDCVNLKKAGLTASCNPMGAGKWRPEFNRYFEGKHVTILADNDNVGRKHANSVARQLHGIATSVKILELSGLPEKGDVSDWLEAGGTAEKLMRLAEETPEYHPLDGSPNRGRKDKTGAKSLGPDRRGLHAVDPDAAPELTTVKSVLPDAPVAEGVMIPEKYYLTRQAVGELIKSHDGSLERIVITRTPIFIVTRFVNLADGTECIQLAWLRDGKWKQHIVPRAVIAATRSITELANQGLPVTCKNAGNLIQYLADFEALNLMALPRAQVSHQMGWQGENGQSGFLWGRTLLQPGRESKSVELESLPLDGDSQNLVVFQGKDAGDEQIADALRACGSFEAWARGINEMVDFPRVLVAVYGAMAAPLLHILGCPNFILDWCGRTSAGKTTTARTGGSCWGNPDERSAASVVGTWDATRVFINRSSLVLHDLPLILDDTKRSKYPRDIAKVLYDFASGRDRGRGSLGGTRRSGTWSSVMLSTGEAPATSFTTDGGTRSRVLTLWGHPFGRADETTAPLVQRLNQMVCSNYGHAGPLLVQFLLSHQSDWQKWRLKYREVVTAYQEKVGADPVAGRLCSYFGALDLTAGIAHAAMDLPWAYRDPIAALWEDLVSGAKEADVAAQALSTVIGWAKANQGSFRGRHQDGWTPLHGWAGRWDLGSSWEYIAFVVHRLNELLRQFDFEPDAVIRGWDDRGWLLTGKGRRQKQVRLDGEQTWMIAIRRSAIEEMEGAP
jgi:putative DNA primase/helicase